MSVADTDMVWYQSAAHPANDTDAAGGNKSSTALVDGNVGELLTRKVAPASGTLDDDAVYQYQQFYLANENGTDDALNTLINLLNGLAVPSGTGVAKYQSTSASDGSSVKVRRHGVLDGGTAVVTKDVVLNGTTEVSGVDTWAEVYYDELLNVADDTPATAVGNITCKVGTESIGFIPAGYNNAAGNLDLWVPATAGNTSGVSNRTTEPAGASWTRAVTTGTAVTSTAPAAGTIAAGTHQSVWIRQRLQPGQNSLRTNVDCVLRASGD
ncbi:MAG: hypothetical protein AB7S38_29045 [Vulcanimicrobiota bacterium]